MAAATYEIDLADTSGPPALLSRQPTRFTVRLRPDRVPLVQAKLFGISSMVVSKAVIPIEMTLQDDFAVTQVRLASDWRIPEEAQSRTGQASTKLDAVKLGGGREKVQHTHRFELEPLQLPVGADLTFHIQADDNDTISGPKTGKSQVFYVKVVQEQDLRAELLDVVDEVEPRVLGVQRQRRRAGRSGFAQAPGVRQRGEVVCGVNTSAPGFSAADSQGRWQGLDVDLCRAVAAAALVVVLAVLALLGIVFSPTLARTSPNTKSVQCLNNHRQLCNAWRMYAADSGDAIVYASNDGTGTSNPLNQYAWVQDHQDFNPSNPGNWDPSYLKRSPLWPYLQVSQILKCPDFKPSTLKYAGSGYISGYGINTQYVAGSPIAGVLGWVPGSGRQTVGVCIFSYNGTVRVGGRCSRNVASSSSCLRSAYRTTPSFPAPKSEAMKVIGRRYLSMAPRNCRR